MSLNFWNVSHILSFVLRVYSLVSFFFLPCGEEAQWYNLGLKLTRFSYHSPSPLYMQKCMSSLKIHKHGVNRCLSDTHAYACHGPQSLLGLEQMKLGKFGWYGWMSRILPFLIEWPTVTTTHESWSPLTWHQVFNDKWWNGGDKSQDDYAEQCKSVKSLYKNLYTDISIKYQFVSNH